MTDGRPVLVAHRAGNALSTLRDAEAAGADMVEADLHLFRGAVEVRHEKTIGPLRVYWERWHLVRRATPPMQLDELLGAVGPQTTLLLDLKGPFRRLSRLARASIRDTFAGRAITVCARNWALLRPFGAEPGVTVIRSVGGRFHLRWVCLRPGLRVDGVSVAEHLLDRQVVARLLERADLLLAWGVTTEARLRELSELGVGGFILDDLGLAGVLLRGSEHRDVRV